MIIEAIFRLLVLHSVDGLEIDVNPAEITSLREAKPDVAGDKLFTNGVRCMINTTDGKFSNVVETCEQIRAMIIDGIKNHD